MVSIDNFGAEVQNVRSLLNLHSMKNQDEIVFPWFLIRFFLSVLRFWILLFRIANRILLHRWRPHIHRLHQHQQRISCLRFIGRGIKCLLLVEMSSATQIDCCQPFKSYKFWNRWMQLRMARLSKFHTAMLESVNVCVCVCECAAAYSCGLQQTAKII